MPTQRQEISASIQANFPDNSSQFITPARLRSEQGLFENYVVLNEQTASIIAQAVASSSAGSGFVTDTAFNAYTSSTNTFTGSIQTQVNALQAATGSYITNAQTSSMSVLSASYAATASAATQFNVQTALTASGLRYPTTDGLVDQVLQTNGAGILSFENVDTILEAVQAGENITKGDPLYISGSQGANPIVYRADAADANKMPVTYIAYETLSAGATGRAIILGLIEGMNLTGYNAGDEVYVAAGGGWTSTRPTGSAIIQFLGIVTKGGNGGKGLVLNPGPATLPNLTSGYVWVGDTNGQPVAVSTSSIATTVNTGSLLATASVVLNTITFTKGDGSTFPITVDTGSGGGGGMNLGANTFTGSQTIASASVYITPTGSTIQYLTESAVRGNLVFGNTNLAQSGSVIVTGSNNILLGIGVSTTGQGGWNGSRNVIITSPQYSGSVPSMNGTINLGNYIASGSGTGTNAISSTFANGGITVTNTSPSSNTTISTSNINATTTIRHAASGSTVANGNLTISTTTLGGSVLISTTGSSTAAKTIAQSMFVGGNITASLEAASNSNLANTIVLGSGLVVSGTLAASSLSGSTIVGQYNETGSLSDPSQVKFVVGTGTSATSRRTSFYVSQSGETVATNLFPATLNTQNTTTIQSTGSITNRIHTKQSGAMPAGGISSSFIISPEIGLEPTAANFKPILQRNLTGSIGPSGSYVFNIDFVNNVLVATSTDLYIGSGKISGFCIPGRTATVAATASVQNYIFNDSSMLPALSSSWDGTLYTVFAKHNGGASSSFAYTGTEFYHSGSTQ